MCVFIAFVRPMFSDGDKNPKHLCFQRQSRAEEGLNIAWLRDGRDGAEFRSSWTELDELGPGTGDEGVQKCEIAWFHWRLLKANWCFFVLAFNQLNPGCSSQHLSIVVADSAVEVFLELARCTAINSDRAVGKMPLRFLDTWICI